MIAHLAIIVVAHQTLNLLENVVPGTIVHLVLILHNRMQLNLGIMQLKALLFQLNVMLVLIVIPPLQLNANCVMQENIVILLACPKVYLVREVIIVH